MSTPVHTDGSPCPTADLSDPLTTQATACRCEPKLRAVPEDGMCLVPSCPHGRGDCPDHPSLARHEPILGEDRLGPAHPSRRFVPDEVMVGIDRSARESSLLLALAAPDDVDSHAAARPDWRDYFLALAVGVAQRADCTRRQVGAVLVSEGHEVLGTGYNGAPAGVPGCASSGACPRGRLDVATVPHDAPYDAPGMVCTADHAERNAVVRFLARMRRLGVTSERALEELRHASIYVTTSPCPQCAALLEAVGITDVVTP